MERRHLLATDHGPMVQGGLLTAHPGSAHGGGEAPGDRSSLRQDAGIGSFGDPDLGIAAAVEQWTKSCNGGLSEGFRGEV